MVRTLGGSDITVSESIGKLALLKVKGPDPFRLWESKGKIFPPSFSISSIPTKRQNEYVVPHPDNGFTLYKDIYERVPVAKTAVDHTANFAIQSGFELEGDDSAKEKVMSWMDDVNFNVLAVKILKQMQIWGNSFLEYDGTKVLDPSQMFVSINKSDEDIIGYKQVVSPANPIDFGPDEIVHFIWNNATTPFYGKSDFSAAVGTIQRLLQFQEDVGEIVHRYGHPILHHKLGTEDSPATQTQINDYIALQEQREVGEDLVTSSAVEVNPVISNLRMIQPDGLINQLEHQLIAGLQIPGLFVKGGENTNKATADVELQAFDRRVKALRTVFTAIMEDKVFKGKLGVDVKISWNELSVESEEQKSTTLMNLVNSGVPTKVALDMVGWGSWIDDFDAAREEEDKRMADKAKQLMQKPNIMGKPVPREEPKEEDFETQEEWLRSYERWKTIWSSS